jgi:two-component system osmolarity sensor histidine kinase EnvZ
MGLMRRFAPRTLFARWLLLLVTPVVLLQVIATYVFYERHWDTVSRRLALGFAGEIAFHIDAREYFPVAAARDRLTALAYRNMSVEFTFEPGARLPESPLRLRAFSILDAMLAQALSERLGQPFRIDTQRDDENVEVLVQLDDGVLHALTREKRLFSTTTYIFIMWMVGASLVLLTIAVLFLRNQIRPIRRLAQAAEAFGKGREVEDFRPAGATEVRQAAAAFIAMRQRILRQIQQRTEMLAGVSHDLRTPLTRMKLQLALLGEQPEIGDLKRDVAEMEKMIEGYLEFARGQEGEAAVETDLSDLLGEVVADMRRQGADVKLATRGDMLVALRPNAFKRCITNLVANALRYARHVDVSAVRKAGAIEIAIDDDGPGIPPERREEVFRPFYRLDTSRNPATGGVGLGLTIARDVIRGHGGDIELGTAPSGGLRALLKLPL